MSKIKQDSPDCRSMTGYGKGKYEDSNCRIEIEIRSVNGRFLEINCRMPRAYMELESEIKVAIGKRLERGRVDVFINRSGLSRSALAVAFNRPLFDLYFDVGREICEEVGEFSKATASALSLELLKNREILGVSEDSADLALERSGLQEALEQALAGLCEMRTLEGRKLGLEVQAHQQELGALAQKIGMQIDNDPARRKAELEQKLKELDPELQLDENRLVQEAALLAEKLDVTEELTRIDSHLAHCLQAFKEKTLGRKLEFLSQELLREFNTINSKCQNAAVQALAVEGKLLIEKLREQAQNIE